MKIGVVRGAFANPSELQNFEPLAKKHEVIVFGSWGCNITPVKLPLVRLFSPYDLTNWSYLTNWQKRGLRAIVNRFTVDSHYLFGLEKKLRGFDIAHCAETYYHYTQQCLNAKAKGYIKKVVCTVWENIPFNNEGIKGRKEFKKRAFTEVDKFFAVTHQAKEALIAEGCQPEKIVVIYPGVDLTRFKPK